MRGPDKERTTQSWQVETMDGVTDKLVYELYGLTAEEIAVVKETGK